MQEGAVIADGSFLGCRSLLFNEQICSGAAAVQRNTLIGVSQVVVADLHLVVAQRNIGGIAGAQGQRGSGSPPVAPPTVVGLGIQIIGFAITYIAQLVVGIGPQQIICDLRGDLIVGNGYLYHRNGVVLVRQSIVLVSGHQCDHMALAGGECGNLAVDRCDLLGVAVTAALTGVNHIAVVFDGVVLVSQCCGVAIGVADAAFGAGMNGAALLGAGSIDSFGFIDMLASDGDSDFTQLLALVVYAADVGSGGIAVESLVPGDHVRGNGRGTVRMDAVSTGLDHNIGRNCTLSSLCAVGQGLSQAAGKTDIAFCSLEQTHRTGIGGYCESVDRIACPDIAIVQIPIHIIIVIELIRTVGTGADMPVALVVPAVVHVAAHVVDTVAAVLGQQVAVAFAVVIHEVEFVDGSIVQDNGIVVDGHRSCADRVIGTGQGVILVGANDDVLVVGTGFDTVGVQNILAGHGDPADGFGVGIAAAITGMDQVAVDFFGGIAVTQSCGLVFLIAVTAVCTGVSGVTLLGAGSFGDDSLVIMAGGGKDIRIAVTTVAAGMGNGAVFGAGCILGNGLILVAGSSYSFTDVAVATVGAQMGGIAVLGTGRIGSDDGVIMTGSLSEIAHKVITAAVTGINGMSAFCAGGSGYGGSIIVTVSIDHFVVCMAAIGAGAADTAVCGASGIDGDILIIMTQGGNIAIYSYLTTGGAGVSSITLFGAGRCSDHGGDGVAQGIHIIVGIAVTADLAGVGGVTVFSLSGIHGYGNIIMAQSCGLVINAAFAANGTGGAGITAFGTGGSDHNSFVAVA